ncbi:MAG TPA: helix-turn-helix domain-containing protein [Acidimicrobiales bacterium]
MARPALSGSRTIEILNFLTAHAGQSFTLTELAKRLDINLASAHAVLAAMTDAGYLVRHPVHKTYELGPLLIPIGRAAQERHRVVDVAREQLEAFAEDRDLEGLVVGATSHELVILERVGRPLPHGMVTTVGQRIRIVPPLGALFAAFAPPQQLEAWMARSTAASGPGDDDGSVQRKLRMIVELARERGFTVGLHTTDRRRMRRALRDLQESPGSARARSELEETVDGLSRVDTVLSAIEPRRTCRVAHVATGVFDEHGSVVLALYVLGFREPMSGREVAEVGHQLTRVGVSVTRATGGTPPRAAAFRS